MANTGYKINPQYKKVTDDINEFPLDVNNQLCSTTGLPQDTKLIMSSDPNYKVYDPEACPPPPVVFYSVQKSGDATKNNCSEGYTPSTETYIVEAGAYNSLISQVDADNQAQADVDANKQAYANSVGTCTAPVFASKWIIDETENYCEEVITDF